MPDDRLEDIAERLTSARRQGTRIALGELPRDYDEAFEVQDRIVANLGEDVVGWKVNELPDGKVAFAPILASGIVPAGGTWTVTGGEPAGIELEIAFRMGRDVPADATADQILDSVASAHVVFELCQSRLARPETVTRLVSVADFIFNAGIVIGDEFTDWRQKPLQAIPGRLLVDGRVHKEGKSVDPVRALSVLPAGLAVRGKTLKAGHVVITGSLIGMNWLTGSRAIKGEIDGCGAVEATVAAAG